MTLADLNETVPFVHQFFVNWIPQLIRNYSGTFLSRAHLTIVDGLRLDAVKHMAPSFWGDFTNASQSFTMGEYYDDDPGYPYHLSPSLTIIDRTVPTKRSSQASSIIHCTNRSIKALVTPLPRLPAFLASHNRSSQITVPILLF